jgi:hypothetical protein
VIGIVGSTDSVDRLQRAAADLGMADQVIARSYLVLEQAVDLATELDGMCNVLLFTGLVPYEMTRAQAPGLHSRLQYIPHGGIDLYRTLALLLTARGGRLPTMSLDTIPADVAGEVFTDLGITPPSNILALNLDRPTRIRSAEDVSAFHEGRYRRGEVELCLTCLGLVARNLEAIGVPVIRVEHTRSSLRDSLVRAALTDRIVRIEDTQTAVALMQSMDSARQGTRIRAVGETLAARLQGKATHAEDGLVLVHTTRGSVERLLGRHRWHWSQLVGDLDALPGTRFGFGVGATATDAEGNSRRALQLDRVGEELYVVLSDGQILDGSGRHGGGRALGSLRQTDERMLAHARDIGLSALTLARLAASLRHIDVYGVETRSIRRLLGTLIEADVAQVVGNEGAPRAGRPQTVYKIDVEKLVPTA